MKTDTINFLEALLFNAQGNDDDTSMQLQDKTVWNFSHAFTEATEKFIDAFRAHLEKTGFDMSKLDTMERSFGGNVYWSLSGAGVGFFDDKDEDIAGLQEMIQKWADGDSACGRFEDLANMLDVGEDGKIDLSIIPEAIEEYRGKYFGVPAAKGI